ncbi:hypothetical protein Goari_004432 [Gossypium aridum]|uniref:Uncharacterized protein n=1 Tax=Gossypium aridum TaxID=34290 RepID=A0A7J8Y3G5_GOSAI|nr:hypothetical protein [Gossypium aridum]
MDETETGSMSHAKNDGKSEGNLRLDGISTKFVGKKGLNTAGESTNSKKEAVRVKGKWVFVEPNHFGGFVIVGGGVYGCGFQLGCGGNGAPSLPQIGTEYRNEFSPDVLCLFETRISGSCADGIIGRIGFLNSCRIEVVYDSPQMATRLSLWDYLGSLAGLIDKP